jgi:hypothetical protein
MRIVKILLWQKYIYHWVEELEAEAMLCPPSSSKVKKCILSMKAKQSLTVNQGYTVMLWNQTTVRSTLKIWPFFSCSFIHLCIMISTLGELSEWLVFNANSAIFQLYQWEKINFQWDDDEVRSLLDHHA